MKGKPEQYVCGSATKRGLQAPSPRFGRLIRGFWPWPVFVLVGCAKQTATASDDAPGFLSGIVHGLIALPALLASLVLDVRVYAFPNNGFWYELGFCGGFLFGIGLLAVPIIPFIGGYLTRRN